MQGEASTSLSFTGYFREEWPLAVEYIKENVLTRVAPADVYVYASSIVLLVGVELDELLREDASSDERGILHVLFGLGR